MKTYTIIAGVNGVGKSSLTGVLKAERNDLGYVNGELVDKGDYRPHWLQELMKRLSR